MTSLIKTWLIVSLCIIVGSNFLNYGNQWEYLQDFVSAVYSLFSYIILAGLFVKMVGFQNLKSIENKLYIFGFSALFSFTILNIIDGFNAYVIKSRIGEVYKGEVTYRLNLNETYQEYLGANTAIFLMLTVVLFTIIVTSLNNREN